MSRDILARTVRAFAALLFAGALVAQDPTLEQLDAARAKLRPLLDALVQVESSGRDDAVGDNGNALGSLQIWRVYWSDALEHAPAIGKITIITASPFARPWITG